MGKMYHDVRKKLLKDAKRFAKRKATDPEKVIEISTAVSAGAVLIFTPRRFSSFLMMGSFASGMLHSNVWTLLRKQTWIRAWMDRWATRIIGRDLAEDEQEYVCWAVLFALCGYLYLWNSGAFDG